MGVVDDVPTRAYFMGLPMMQAASRFECGIEAHRCWDGRSPQKAGRPRAPQAAEFQGRRPVSRQSRVTEQGNGREWPRVEQTRAELSGFSRAAGEGVAVLRAENVGTQEAAGTEGGQLESGRNESHRPTLGVGAAGCWLLEC